MSKEIKRCCTVDTEEEGSRVTRAQPNSAKTARLNLSENDLKFLVRERHTQTENNITQFEKKLVAVMFNMFVNMYNWVSNWMKNDIITENTDLNKEDVHWKPFTIS